MTVKNRILRVFNAVAMLLLLSSSRLFAQNLIYNGDFEITSGNLGIEYTDYQRIWSGGVESGQFIHDVTSTNHGSGSLGGWPSNLTGYGGSGYYLLYNGFGGSINPTKVVWRQTVNVTSQTTYTFSCQLRNLSQSFMGFNANTAIIRIKINGNTAGQDVTFSISNHDWQEVTRTWNSGNVSGPITIEIFDVFTGEPGSGDDFGLDHISFTPNVLYSITANEDAAFVCFGNTVQIPVMNNDNIQPQPSGSNAPTVTVLTPQSQIPGTTTNVTVSNNIISYNFNDPNYSGNTVDFQYRLSWHGLTSDAWVHITLGRPPTIGSINLSSPITLCVGESLTLPTPTVTPNGSSVTNQGWQVKVNGNWQNVNGNSIPSVANGYTSIRYYAENQCDTSYSNEFQLVVSDEPTIGSISNIIPSSFCAPATFSCSPPSIQNNGSEPIAWGWQMQIGGQWVSVPNPIEYQHNGCNIRYYATNDCGTNYSNTVAITVNAVPIVPNITASAGVCEGQALVLTPPSNIQWRHNDQNTCSGCWQVYLNGAWQDISGNSIPSISYNTYNGCHIRYKAHNGCGDGYSNEVAITVYSTQPVDLGDVTFCQEGEFHGVWCSQDGHVYGYDSLTPNNCTVHVSWLFHLNEDYNIVPQTEVACNEFPWSQNGMTYSTSGTYYDTVPNPNPVECDDVYVLNLTVNHAPVITGQLQSPDPMEICSSDGALNVAQPAFEPNHDEYTTHWEYASLPDGTWNVFNPTSFNLGYGSYSLRFVVDNDCVDVPVSSNTVPFYVSEAPVINGQLTDMEICEGNTLNWPQMSVEWNNRPEGFRLRRWEKAQTPDGTFAPFDTTAVITNDCWIRYYAQNSCNDDILGPVHVSVISVNDEEMTHEDCDLVVFEGHQYTSDTVIDVQLNEPCPHTIYHNIVVHHSEYIMEPIPQTTCHDEFVWHGQTYYRSEGLEQLMHFDTVTEYGCNKVMEQQLVFDSFSTKTESRKACGVFWWSRNDSTYVYDENQLHIQDSWFIPGDGEACDSIIYLSLDLDREYEYEGDPMTECYGFDWHGVTYYEDAIVYDSLTTKIAHCDSIISYRLTIIQPFDTIVEMESCQPVWWQNHLFENDGDEFTATLESTVTGCDSIVTIHFSLADNIEKIIDATVCEPFVLPNGQTVNDSGQWTYIIPSYDDCDTTVYLNVNFIQTDILTDEPQYACNSFTFHGFTYGPGIHEIYHDTVFAQNGCISSVQLLNLTVKDSEQIGVISGNASVYVASSLISGIYRYEIDMEGLDGPVTWSLSNPDWQIVEQGDGYCRVLVTTPGTSLLIARFNVEECGEMERTFEIGAGFFGVDDIQDEVRVFPNPTRGSVTVEAEGIESFRLTNMMGQVLEMRECDGSDRVVLNLKGYTPSVYLLEVKTAYGIAKKRLVLCR